MIEKHIIQTDYYNKAPAKGCKGCKKAPVSTESHDLTDKNEKADLRDSFKLLMRAWSTLLVFTNIYIS